MTLLSSLLSKASVGTARTLDRLLQRQQPSVSEIASLLNVTGVDYHLLCAAADHARLEANGDEVSFVVNRNINFTNVCVKRCRFCAFSRTGAGKGSEEGYYLEIDDIVKRAVQAQSLGATEVCVQAGLPPQMAPYLYMDIARAIKAACPGIHLHAFSPEEVLQVHGS